MLNLLKLVPPAFSVSPHLPSLIKLSIIHPSLPFMCNPQIIHRAQSTRELDKFETTKLITLENVKQFATLTNDLNPIHLEPSAENQPPIVHGALLISLVAGVMGSDFPGPGCIVLSKEIVFIQACPVGTYVRIEVAIEHAESLNKPRKISNYRFSCHDSNDKSICFMKGKARLRVKSK